ncbi:uncharacterized protein FOMMEDRAFT_159228 [Fomitiporia mediterranea MF3/22]|uniref:uncharacterized protein n=1 Tax=Fomitiporia mediterranea (strain MF3/22) TaxID=694068 RepID=UPI0004407891|nr:uncharacterized protein FOMMEDRAFT_159228 [Fomitiporia mediterranea MF3/22]EJD00504.1 hypothetical protein FOMMEDRAFT_159228 [Fomitiporia mediterranea MF3/22]
MSPSTSSDQHRFVVFFPYNYNSVPRSFLIHEDAYVQDLEDAIGNNQNYKRLLENEELYLYKCRDLNLRPSGTLYERAVESLLRDSERMNSCYYLSKYFANGPAPKKDKIDIIVATHSVLESYTSERTMPQISKIRRLPSPSQGIRDEYGIKQCTDEKRGVHIHRPAFNYGPPTALFNHSLARLKHRLQHLDKQAELEPEDYRELALRYRFGTLVGTNISSRYKTESGTAQPNAAWDDAVRIVMEVKNEDGLRGNATLQAIISYSKILSQNKYKKYVERSNCPVVLLGIMGSRLEISTAIFTNGIYIDKLLSEELYLDAWQAEKVLRLGRIFMAVSLASSELREYYVKLEHNIRWAPRTVSTAHQFPNPLPTEGQDIAPLTYLGKLSQMGELVNEGDNEEVQQERRSALYRAKMSRDGSDDEVDVVVKFTAHYHEDAHQMLAEEQLAPTLHCCIHLVGGMYMVIMDYVEGTSLYFTRKFRDCEKIYRDVERAIKLLSDRDLVFGDLQVQNIIPKPSGGAMLIDFDWVGKHKESRYPASWNIDERWAPGLTATPNAARWWSDISSRETWKIVQAGMRVEMDALHAMQKLKQSYAVSRAVVLHYDSNNAGFLDIHCL